MEARNASYPAWAAADELVVTPGDETDYATIEADILDFGKRFKVESLGYDPWGSTQLGAAADGTAGQLCRVSGNDGKLQRGD